MRTKRGIVTRFTRNYSSAQGWAWDKSESATITFSCDLIVTIWNGASLSEWPSAINDQGGIACCP